MRQVDTELRRFFARRIVRGAVIITLLVATLSIGIITVRGHPGNGAPIAVPVTGAGPQPVVVPAGPYEPGSLPPAGAQITYGQDVREVRDTRIDVGHGLQNTLVAMAIIMVFMCIVLGASFVGADFNVGSLTSQLLYEPRRWRIHLAKAAGVAIGCAAVSVCVCVAIGVLMYGGSEVHGIVRGIDATWWRHRGIDLARAALAAAVAGVMAYAATIVLHRTSAAIVAFLVQFPFIHIVDDHTPVFGPISRVAPFRGMMAITADIHSSVNSDIGIRTNLGALVFTAIWIVIVVGASGVIFSRSEVR